VGLILLDSTVVVGFLDADDALHEAAVAKLKGLAGRHPLVASVITYAEVLTGVSLGHHARGPVDGFFDSLLADLLPVDKRLAARAAVLRGENPSLMMPDALILATADGNADIETALSADSQWPRVQGLNCRIELLKPGNPRAGRRK
jgi:predicted nucleic acid-binding protein